MLGIFPRNAFFKWHLHDLFTYFDDDDFKLRLVYVNTIFWESIQALRRGVIIVFYEMNFEKLCFCPLTLLFCAPPGFR